MEQRRLGASGPLVSALGLGCMGMSWGYAEGQRNDESSVQIIAEAVDLGVTFFDTSDVYGDGHNERLLGKGLAGRRDEVVLATKCGLVVDDLATRAMHRDGRPERVRAAAEASLRRLDTDVVDLLYLHRVDPDVPLAETWGAMAGLVEAGKVGRLGLSEVSIAQAAEAHRQHPVAAVQSELSLWTREPLGRPGDELEGLPVAENMVGWCARNDVAFIPFAPLGRGFLTGAYTSPDQFEQSDFRASSPRFQDEALTANGRIVDVVRAVAGRHGATPAQIALAWTLAQGEHVIPVPGTKNSRYLRENAEAAALRLGEEDLAELDGVPEAVGSRY
ncbi:aldo/keto reductase [Streptomyces sp. NPDC051776]|uniref:aldo/keto reductase n=1 Tax=Streptomyces sp. NPDC051776 TaxID=3155414 RepID=UPI0034341DCA